MFKDLTRSKDSKCEKNKLDFVHIILKISIYSLYILLMAGWTRESMFILDEFYIITLNTLRIFEHFEYCKSLDIPVLVYVFHVDKFLDYSV